MLAIALVAVTLVAGRLYLENRWWRSFRRCQAQKWTLRRGRSKLRLPLTILSSVRGACYARRYDDAIGTAHAGARAKRTSRL
jgi:hypothetical protein